jgi:hemolysin III
MLHAKLPYGLSETIPFIVFGLSVVLMYASSATYHLLHVSDKTRAMLRRVDHTMIFLLIAGTYTPFCMIPLRDTYGVSILVLIWSLAVAGFFVKLFWMSAPRWFSTALYVGMGWISISVVYSLSQTLSSSGLISLFAGGIFYTVGAVIYAVKKPDPFPPHFGFHEIWHLFVLAGTASHFYSVMSLL